MQQINLKEKDKIRVKDIQGVFETITGYSDVNKAFPELIKDYLNAKIFQLSVQVTQLELKWGYTYNEFEKESVKWENGASYEIEQEYYHWGELISELEHFTKLKKQWT